jgi:hypothetical protein
MLYYNQANTELEVMRIQRLWPQEDWRGIWRNLHDAPVAAHHKASWYKASHDIVRTNSRLKKIRMVDTDKCRHCGIQDTLLHRFIVCGQGALTWNWTATKITRILSTVAKNIPQDWLFRPQMWNSTPDEKKSGFMDPRSIGHVPAWWLPQNFLIRVHQLCAATKDYTICAPKTQQPSSKLTECRWGNALSVRMFLHVGPPFAVTIEMP